ncbi:MAG: hypothetical protein MZV65_52520 [Chromatiales bacterium]|nr:hypothetical protein [Chromatiales bacterium]
MARALSRPTARPLSRSGAAARHEPRERPELRALAEDETAGRRRRRAAPRAGRCNGCCCRSDPNDDAQHLPGNPRRHRRRRGGDLRRRPVPHVRRAMPNAAAGRSRC